MHNKRSGEKEEHQIINRKKHTKEIDFFQCQVYIYTTMCGDDNNLYDIFQHKTRYKLIH